MTKANSPNHVRPMMSAASYKIICEEVQPGSTAQLTPGKLQKVVHLVRHGQAHHNVYAMSRLKEGQKCPCMFNKPGCPYLNPLNEDPELTLTGRLQATTVGPKLLNTRPQPQVCFVSPLKRTLQTATFGLSTAHGLDIPMIAVEMVRERMGLHVCDKRTDKAKVGRNFRNVDFTDILPGPEDYPDERETEIQTAERGRSFFLTLKDRAESSVLVVTHSSLLYNTLSKCFECPNPKTARRFVTGETRCVVLTYEKVEEDE